ncbi:MAG: 30S ribosomal protein S6 [Spirochaetales bacterium]|jgi:small subunit ribosomal protein S6|nr:30S ribosomal protein S6 [Spirochaetales bacterium]
MRNYEFTAIFYSDEEKATNGAQYVLKKFEEAGVQIDTQEDMGIRQLAYIIKKEDKGHYWYYEIQADPDKINTLTADFLLSGNLLKFLFVVK